MLYVPEKKDPTKEGYEEMIRVYKANEKRIDAIDDECKKKGELLHRFIIEGVADGKAIYQIVRVNKSSVRIKACSLDGEYYDYIIPMWGNEATIPLEYAIRSIRFRDKWQELLDKKAAESKE